MMQFLANYFWAIWLVWLGNIVLSIKLWSYAKYAMEVTEWRAIVFNASCITGLMLFLTSGLSTVLALIDFIKK